MDQLLFDLGDRHVTASVKRVVEAYNFSQHLGLGKLWVAFSGGKDSVCLYGVCKLAAEQLGMDLEDMAEFHYNVTTVDPPELVQFIKSKFPFVYRDRPEMTMWDLIVKKRMPPTRIARYCCEYLKERSGKGRFCLTGVRWAESVRRKNTRGVYEDYGKKPEERILFEDNTEDRRKLEHCVPKQRYIVNPIIDWTDDMVWQFIKTQGLPYCKLYDRGYHRLGCIGCPMAPLREREKEFKDYPKIRDQYVRTYDRMLVARRQAGLPTEWKSGEQVMKWWLEEES